MGKLKYFFMPSRWRSFSIWLLKRALLKLDNSAYEPKVYEIEQYMYRYITCSDCMKAGKCIHSDCGCLMPARAHVTTDICPTGKWGPFLPKKLWEKKMKDFEFVIINKKLEKK